MDQGKYVCEVYDKVEVKMNDEETDVEDISASAELELVTPETELGITVIVKNAVDVEIADWIPDVEPLFDKVGKLVDCLPGLSVFNVEIDNHEHPIPFGMLKREVNVDTGGEKKPRRRVIPTLHNWDGKLTWNPDDMYR